LGQRFSFPRAVVQIAGTFYVTSAEALRRAVAASDEAKVLVQQYIEALWAEAQQIATCNAAHDAAPRLARWLLQCADRTGTKRFMVTQEFLGERLGVRRTTLCGTSDSRNDRCYRDATSGLHSTARDDRLLRSASGSAGTNTGADI
jgi:hypothetical protein